MLDLALHYGQGPVLVKNVAKREGVSQHYLEHLFIQLVAAGFVNSTRGAKGGLTLAKPPAQIRVSEVIEVMEGSSALVHCVDDPKSCARSDICVTRDLWADIKTAMSGVLEATTFQDLVERQREKEQATAIMYYI
jgi:Rrf2 family protein